MISLIFRNEPVNRNRLTNRKQTYDYLRGKEGVGKN